MAGRLAESSAASDAGSEAGGPGWEAIGRLEAQRVALQRAVEAAEAGQAAASSLLADCQADLHRQQQVTLLTFDPFTQVQCREGAV